MEGLPTPPIPPTPESRGSKDSKEPELRPAPLHRLILDFHPLGPCSRSRFLGDVPPKPISEVGASAPGVHSRSESPRYLQSPGRKTFRIVFREPGARGTVLGDRRGGLYNCPRCCWADRLGARPRSSAQGHPLAPALGIASVPYRRLLQSLRAISRALQTPTVRSDSRKTRADSLRLRSCVGGLRLTGCVQTFPPGLEGRGWQLGRGLVQVRGGVLHVA